MTLGAVSAVLFLIIVGRLFVRLLSRATEGKIPVDVVMPLLGFGSIKAIIFLLPVGFLIAIMMTLGRLYRDSEMAALRACGVSNWRLYRPLLAIAVPIAALLTVLVLFVTPWSVQRTDQLVNSAQQRTDLRGLNAGQFMAAAGGSPMLFVEAIDDDGQQVSNVFVHSFEEGVPAIETARRARQQVDPETGARVLVLMDGHRYEGSPGQADYRILAYQKHAVRVPQIEASKHVERDALPTAVLWSSEHKVHKAELQWRLSVPLSAIVVALLAVPLSYSAPRQGRFSKVVVAILIYVVYANLTIASVKWVERGAVPEWVGVWWVHLAVLAFAGLLALKQRGLFSRRPRVAMA